MALTESGYASHYLNLTLGARAGAVVGETRSRQGSVTSFPLFFAWIQELQPGKTLEETARVTQEKLTAILSRKLSKFGLRTHDDIIDCLNDVLLFMEKRLGSPMEFPVKSVLRRAGKIEARSLEVKIIHLLRPLPYAIVLCHPSLEPPATFRARLRDVKDGTEVAAVGDLACVKEKRVPVHLSYDALDHEQSAVVELLPEGDFTTAYRSTVKAVRHESFPIRMGFLASSARNLALEHARRRRGPRALSIEELPTADIPAPGDEARQQVAVLIARRAIDSFPATLRKQMFRHYVDGCSWAEIAEEFAASEDTVKKNVSRALIKVSDAILAGETEATKGAEGRVVRWLKEMLPRIPVRL